MDETNNKNADFFPEDFTYTPAWNLLLITLGSIIFAAALKGVAVHHNFMPGGIFGASLLIFYVTDWISAGKIYFLINIPLFILGWIHVSRRFVLYSLYAVIVTTGAYEILDINFHIHQQIYAAIACGGIMGAGAGLVLRSLGSNGGLDIIGIILNQKYNLGLGKFFFFFNLTLFCVSSAVLDIDLIIASVILVFVCSSVIDYVLALFNQRKVVLVISDESQAISRAIMDVMKRGVTFLKGKGAYTGRDRDILMTIINNVQLKRLEGIVFSVDPNAIFIVENTFNVLGSNFSKRKIY